MPSLIKREDNIPEKKPKAKSVAVENVTLLPLLLLLLLLLFRHSAKS